MDEIELQILKLVQPNADRSLAQIGRAVRRSQAACFKRLQRLKEQGIIRRKVMLLDPEALNVPATILVTVKRDPDEKRPAAGIAAVLGQIPEVMDVFHVAESDDFLLRIVLPDKRMWNALQARLQLHLPNGDMIMRVADCLHAKTSLPLHFVSLVG